jgi:hypothetical protein
MQETILFYRLHSERIDGIKSVDIYQCIYPVFQSLYFVHDISLWGLRATGERRSIMGCSG